MKHFYNSVHTYSEAKLDNDCLLHQPRFVAMSECSLCCLCYVLIFFILWRVKIFVLFFSTFMFYIVTVVFILQTSWITFSSIKQYVNIQNKINLADQKTLVFSVLPSHLRTWLLLSSFSDGDICEMHSFMGQDFHYYFLYFIPDLQNN